MLLAQAGTHAFARRTLAGPDPALALILVAPPIRESSGLLTDPSECDRPDNPKTLVVVPVVRVVPVAGAAALPVTPDDRPACDGHKAAHSPRGLPMIAWHFRHFLSRATHRNVCMMPMMSA